MVDLLVVGHVTRDEVDGGVRLGGAGSYAALAAACLGYETALVTVAPPDDPLLEPLRRAPHPEPALIPGVVEGEGRHHVAGRAVQVKARRGSN